MRPALAPTSNAASGNPVSLDAKSVRKQGNIVNATVRVVFTTPVQTPKGAWMSARTMASFDCVKKSLAANEITYYGDRAESKVVEHKVNKIPGYGPALGGSLGDVALKHLCSAH